MFLILSQKVPSPLYPRGISLSQTRRLKGIKLDLNQNSTNGLAGVTASLQQCFEYLNGTPTFLCTTATLFERQNYLHTCKLPAPFDSVYSKMDSKKIMDFKRNQGADDNSS